MKFLVLALCVYAANAASLGLFNTRSSTLGLKDGANVLTTAGNILATPAVAAANIAASSIEAASKSDAAPASKVIATPAVTTSKSGTAPATKVIATPAVTAAQVVAPPAVTATKVIATPAVVPAKSDANPKVAAAKVVATPAVAAAEFAAVPVVAAAKAAAPAASSAANSEGRASVVHDKSDVRPDGFTFGYETDSGIIVESTGILKNVNGTNALVINGSYEYIDADGSKVKVTYVADENGFRAESDRLPVAPPTPQVILDALQYIATHPKWVDPSVKN